MRRMVQRAGIVAAVAAAIGACGGGGPTTNTPVVRIAKTATASGDAQTATVATAVPNQIRVLVTQDGSNKAGATITWTALAGSVTPGTSVTDANGIAVTNWTLGNVSGAESLYAALHLALGSPQLYLATAQADLPTAMVKNAGDGQVAGVGTAFVQPVSVRVRDHFGNGVPGVAIDWTVLSGSLTADALSSVSNAQGIGSLTLSAGNAPGPGVIRATTSALSGFILDFNLTVSPTPITVTASGAALSVAFTSATNGSVNPAVDTIPVGGAIKWVQGSGTHSVVSSGSPTFAPSGTLTASGYTVVFPILGIYAYECGVHGPSMNGRVVVQ